MIDHLSVVSSSSSRCKPSTSSVSCRRPNLWIMLGLAMVVWPHSVEGRGQCSADRYIPRHGSYPTSIIHNGYSGFLTPAVAIEDNFFRIGQPTFQPLIPQRFKRQAPACHPAACPTQPIIIIQRPAAPAPRPAAVVTRPAPVAPTIAQRNPNAIDNTVSEPGQLYLWIQQAEATVSLDGINLGSGEDIEALDLPMEVSAGVHVLVTEHPDFGSERLVFAIPAGEELLVEINLSGNRSGRKARLRTAHEIAARLPLLAR